MIIYRTVLLKWWRQKMQTFPRYWPFVWEINRSPVNFTHKGQWRGALIFIMISAWTHGWANNRDTSDLRHYRAHYGDTVIQTILPCLSVRAWRGSAPKCPTRLGGPLLASLPSQSVQTSIQICDQRTDTWHNNNIIITQNCVACPLDEQADAFQYRLFKTCHRQLSCAQRSCSVRLS